MKRLLLAAALVVGPLTAISTPIMLATPASAALCEGKVPAAWLREGGFCAIAADNTTEAPPIPGTTVTPEPEPEYNPCQNGMLPRDFFRHFGNRVLVACA